MIAVSVKTATPSALARVSADHTYCHVVDGVRRRRRVHGTSNGGVNGGVEKRALRAVVEGGEELADTRIGQATRFVRTFAEIVYSAVFAHDADDAMSQDQCTLCTDTPQQRCIAPAARPTHPCSRFEARVEIRVARKISLSSIWTHSTKVISRTYVFILIFSKP